MNIHGKTNGTPLQAAIERLATGEAMGGMMYYALARIAEHHGYADIAKEFSISENTVKHTITAIFAKLGATTRAEAAAIAHRKHLVDA